MLNDGRTRELASPGAIGIEDPSLLRRPNPVHPSRMTPAARRKELCALLAAGLARLHRRNFPELYDEIEGFPLHFASEQSGSAAPTHWRNAQ